MGPVDGTNQAAECFIECLGTLPNLHTLEINFIWQHQVVEHFADTLKKKKPELPQIRTLVLSDAVHWLLRCCPKVEDLTCCEVAPGMDFVESLVAGGSNSITKFSIMCPGRTWQRADIWPSRIYFISAHDYRGGLIRVSEIARACPGIRELSVAHVSLTSMTLTQIADANVGHVPCHPSVNKKNHWGEDSLLISKQRITAFKNLSKIVLIHYLGYGYRRSGYKGWVRSRSARVWNEVKDVAISQLEGSLADGPKKLKIIIAWAMGGLEPGLVVEEIIL